MSPPPTIGLIAGNGAFPALFARAARRAGARVVAVGMIGETLPLLAPLVDQLSWVRVGQLGRMIRLLRRAGVVEAAMAGGVQKARLFSGARPDWRGLRVLTRAWVRRDDGMLRAIAAEFERDGIRIVDSTRYMPDALSPAGVLTRRAPSPQQWQDLRYGWQVARQFGQMDIGQTVVVRSGAVVALEAIEGTDACIRRGGSLTGGQGAVVVKLAKPNQDMRFDVPVVGLGTLDSLAAAGARVLGLEAQRTLLLAPAEFLAAADRRGLVVVGLSPASLPQEAPCGLASSS